MKSHIFYTICILNVAVIIFTNAAATTKCPDEYELANGSIKCLNKTVGETCTFTCETGYSGAGTVNCTSSGDWSAVPSCTINRCPDETNLNHGYIFCKGATYGDQCEYTCDTFHGYGKTVTCQADGTWSKTPACAGCSLSAALSIVCIMSLMQFIITNF